MPPDYGTFKQAQKERRPRVSKAKWTIARIKVRKKTEWLH